LIEKAIVNELKQNGERNGERSGVVREGGDGNGKKRQNDRRA
jgi:hypothetical protein